MLWTENYLSWVTEGTFKSDVCYVQYVLSVLSLAINSQVTIFCRPRNIIMVWRVEASELGEKRMLRLEYLVLRVGSPTNTEKDKVEKQSALTLLPQRQFQLIFWYIYSPSLPWAMARWFAFCFFSGFPFRLCLLRWGFTWG